MHTYSLQLRRRHFDITSMLHFLSYSESTLNVFTLLRTRFGLIQSHTLAVIQYVFSAANKLPEKNIKGNNNDNYNYNNNNNSNFQSRILPPYQEPLKRCLRSKVRCRELAPLQPDSQIPICTPLVWGGSLWLLLVPPPTPRAWSYSLTSEPPAGIFR